MDKCFCTIFTPTYNRGNLLTILYKSLCQQTCKDFEWLIVDDGSTDDTEKIVEDFIKRKEVNIRYFKTSNGGKHRAINFAIDRCESKVFGIVDSDDCLKENAIEVIKSKFDEIKNIDKKYVGVGFNKGYKKEGLVGTTFQGEFIDAKNNERQKNNITGDKFEVFYSNILKQYKFPEFENEKFMSEIVVWNRLANAGYYLRWYNEIIYLCEYLNDGLTKNQFKLFKNSPKGYALRIREEVQFGNITYRQKLGYYSNYFFIFRSEKRFKEIAKDIDAGYLTLSISIFLRKMQLLLKGGNDGYK